MRRPDSGKTHTRSTTCARRHTSLPVALASEVPLADSDGDVEGEGSMEGDTLMLADIVALSLGVAVCERGGRVKRGMRNQA
jgi:hypothetical protein